MKNHSLNANPLFFVHFTMLWPRSRDQQSKWMQGGCKAYMDSYMLVIVITFVIGLQVGFLT